MASAVQSSGRLGDGIGLPLLVRDQPLKPSHLADSAVALASKLGNFVLGSVDALDNALHLCGGFTEHEFHLADLALEILRLGDFLQRCVGGNVR